MLTLLPPRLWKHHLKKIFSILYSWPPIKRTLLLGLIYLYIAVATCVNVCERACLVRAPVCAHAGWVMCNCVCMCLCPQRYFNFFRILNKHAAAASAERCLPVALGLDGWRCWWWGEAGGGLWPWLWGGEAAHGQGPRRTQWRLALEDFWTTTLLQRKACQHWLAAVPRFQPKSLSSPSPSLLLLPFFLSFSLSLPLFLPDTSHSLSFLILLNRVQVHLLFRAHRCAFRGRLLCFVFSLPFYWMIFFFNCLPL